MLNILTTKPHQPPKTKLSNPYIPQRILIHKGASVAYSWQGTQALVRP